MYTGKDVLIIECWVDDKNASLTKL